jgi:hypothetical protein
MDAIGNNVDRVERIEGNGLDMVSNPNNGMTSVERSYSLRVLPEGYPVGQLNGLTVGDFALVNGHVGYEEREVRVLQIFSNGVVQVQGRLYGKVSMYTSYRITKSYSVYP